MLLKSSQPSTHSRLYLQQKILYEEQKCDERRSSGTTRIALARCERRHVKK